MGLSHRSFARAAPLALALVAACGGEERAQVQLHADASLRDSILAIEPLYEAATGVDLVTKFGPSGKLRMQIERGARPDVFVAAGAADMTALDRIGLLAAGTRRDLLADPLVVVVPQGGRRPSSVGGLTEPWVERLAIGESKKVPSGRLAVAWLQAAKVWTELEPRVRPCADVGAVLSAVEEGSVSAGIVQRTDAVARERVDVAFAAGDEATPILYPAAVLADRPKDAEARALLEFLGGPESVEIFDRAGFVARAPAPPGEH